MNISIIRYILGSVLKTEGILLLLPCLTALYYKETQGYAYLIVAVSAFILGYLCTLKKPRSTVFYLKEGCIATASSWILMSVIGSIPFMLTGEIPSFTDALFETISGLTTTGSSILSDVEALSHASLMWRSFTHWIGGMGVLVFVLAILPLKGGSHMNLMKAESPGPSVGKLVPKVQSTAQILYGIYILLTVIQFILLLIGKMPVFDAITLTFGTAGTGGFGIKNDSIASYTAYQQWVITIFMMMFGINFNFYYYLLFRQFKKAFRLEEVRYYVGIILAAILIIFVNTLHLSPNSSTALRDAAFQVGAIITTTGYSTADFILWPTISKTVLVLLMFLGACAGSTGGGMKVSRLVILFKTVGKELRSYIHPKSIRSITFEHKSVESEVVRSTNVFFITYMLIFATSVFLISLEGQDVVTTFTSVIATFNNIGPGLEAVGPVSNFGHFSHFSKWVLMFDMLAGRLELFPLLLLFHPLIYKDLFKSRFKKKRNSTSC